MSKVFAVLRIALALVLTGTVPASVRAQSSPLTLAPSAILGSPGHGSSRSATPSLCWRLGGLDQLSALPDNKATPTEHRFWDRGNAWLFSAVAASRTLDYFSTLNMRRRGRQEIFLTNDVVDNHPAFAAVEAAATAASIGASYLFHRYHHHRLERWTSIIHASLATSGAVRNYCLESAHRLTPP